MKPSFYKAYFEEINSCVNQVNQTDLEKIIGLIQNVVKNEKKIIIVGNGGSAAMASHVCVDFTKAAGIRAVNFNEADLITCFANDYGYENWVSQAIEKFADQGDLVILISSSGKSPNIINAAKKSKSMDIPVVTLSGFTENNPLRELGDINLWADSKAYNTVEMAHHIWLLALVDRMIDLNHK